MPLITRELVPEDLERGFLDLLSQLTEVGEVDRKDVLKRYEELEREGNRRIVVVLDEQMGRVLATGTAFLEKKFIRNCGCVAHIEDVVVDRNTRGKHLGKLIVDDLLEYARLHGCYKAILDCSEENVGFYEKCGFYRKEVQMACYFGREKRCEG